MFWFLIKAWGFYSASMFLVRAVRLAHKLATSNKRYQSTKRHGAEGKIEHQVVDQPRARDLVAALFEGVHHTSGGGGGGGGGGGAGAGERGTSSVHATVKGFIDHADQLSSSTGSNCIVSNDALRQQAMQHAKVLDTARSRKAVSLEEAPLFGLPVSVKECYQVHETTSTHGLVRYRNDPATEQQESVLVRGDSVGCRCSYVLRSGTCAFFAKSSRRVHMKYVYVSLLPYLTQVRMLRNLGAVPFCKTNVPQIMYAWECSNPVYGTTSHPLHRDYVPGAVSYTHLTLPTIYSV